MDPESPVERRRRPTTPRVGNGKRWNEHPRLRFRVETFTDALAADFHARRECKGWTLDEMARHVEMRANSIRDIENCRVIPDLPTVLRIYDLGFGLEFDGVLYSTLRPEDGRYSILKRRLTAPNPGIPLVQP
jgi:DNA-binding XRE family transcriptional regulator